MKIPGDKVAVRCKTLSVPIPKTRDPFVNTPLISLGSDANGLERFWISTWNSVVGTTCALVNEAGEYRIYRPGKPHWGFYSAAQEDQDTLWLCGSLDRVVRLTLSSGRFETFSTGVPAALLFQGMIFDPDTKRLFAVAYPPPTTTAFSFDTRAKKTVRTYTGFSLSHYMRQSFPNGDGTWSSIVCVPGEVLVRWDPRSETIKVKTLREQVDPHPTGGSTRRLMGDDQGRRYLPGHGWYDPATGRISRSGPRPNSEMTWFARLGETAYGVNEEGEKIRIGAWNLRTGQVTSVCDIPDCQIHNVNVTASGKIVAVNVYGVFYRFDARTGALEMSKALPTDAVGVVDCFCRLDDAWLLGTPFITQRFWEVNLKTGQGIDCGRAAPGAGEVLQTWQIGGKVYMAAYTGGELVEYDPARHPHFPENPRVVADPPHGMRPVAAADDGRFIFYACSAPYGSLGSVLTKYDTRTGLATYCSDPLPHQQIQSLSYDRKTDALLCGTTMHSDCQSCPPSSDRCYLARIAAGDLTVQAKAAAPKGTQAARVVGPLGRGRWLYTFTDGGVWWAAVALNELRTPTGDELQSFADGFGGINPTDKAGLFLLRVVDRIELWDMRRNRRESVLVRGIDDRFYVYRFLAQGKSVYLATPKGILVLEDVL